jgi:PAS domain S-box-containing protein
MQFVASAERLRQNALSFVELVPPAAKMPLNETASPTASDRDAGVTAPAPGAIESPPLEILAAATAQACRSVMITEATSSQDEAGSRVVYVNQEFTRMTGYAPDEVLGRSPGILLVSQISRDELRRTAEAVARGEPATVEVMTRCKDGAELPTRLGISPLRAERGRPARFLMLQHDIGERASAGPDSSQTARVGLERMMFEQIADLRRANMLLSAEVEERRRAEAALQEARAELESRMEQRSLELRASEERYRQLFEKAGQAIYILEAEGDGMGTILEANTAAAAMHGYTVDELRTRTQMDLDAPEVADGTPGNIRRMGHGEWIEGETVHVRKDGTRISVEFSAGPLDVGDTRFIIKFARDITERKRGEETLRQAKMAADAASRAKSAFLANMSHEIRTPMNAILGYTQLLERDPKLAPEQKKHLEVITRSGEHLLELINDVLEMSRIESGHRKLNRGDLDLSGLLDELTRVFRARAAAKLLRFEVHRAPDLPRHIVTDGSKLRQILVNLVGNAVKFTGEGGVTVRAEARHGQAGDVRMTVEVEDTGPGIGHEKLDELFRPFAQARVGIHAQGGTGLGLALSREFARLLGGDITLESRPGQGSVFRLEIPIEVGSAPAHEPATPRGRVMGVAGAARRVRILVVDDESDNRGWLRQLLEQVGFEIREAGNGAEALACFDAWRPHLVLIDMHMPIMDGFAAMRAIRARPSGRRAAIVGISSSTFEEEHDTILEAGADGVVRKPCCEPELLEEIRKQLGIEYSYGEAPPPERISELPDFAAMRTDLARTLPAELVIELRSAARVADYDRLKELVAEIPAEHAALASALGDLVEVYGYEQIEGLLKG